MTQDEFSKELIRWRQELTDEVTPHFRLGDRERGSQAFERWRERFTRFLQGHTATEANRFKQQTTHLGYRVYHNEHPLHGFMRKDGATCVAFIDDLSEAAQKGRIADFHEIALLPKDQNATRQIGNTQAYVDLTRLDALRAISPAQFDISKLIRFCEELNSCYANECYLAVAMLGRSILDHIPPIFGCKSFAEVANNYSGGSKSFKESMQHLDKSSRKIADAHLHEQIRRKEVLPNRTQVNFASDFDVLLAEIIRVLAA